MAFALLTQGGQNPALTEADTLAALASLELPERIDLGQAAYGSTVPYAFTITNPSSKAITVPYIDTSCGCTTVTRAPVTIEPGGEVIISGAFTVPTRITQYGGGASIFVGLDPTEREVIGLRAPLVAPLSLQEGVQNRWTVHPLYRDNLVSAVCYPVGSDTPLPATLTADGSSLVIDAPTAGDVEVVLTLNPSEPGGEVFQLMQPLTLSGAAAPHEVITTGTR